MGNDYSEFKCVLGSSTKEPENIQVFMTINSWK